MDVKAVRECDAVARRGFTYEGDGAFDTWRSHADAALAGRPWSGDCDDLASTVMDLLGRRGVPLNLRYRLLVGAQGAGIDHMVGCVHLPGAGFYIVGDTFGPAYQARAMAHAAHVYHRLDEWIGDEPVWRDGKPWK